MESVRTWPWGGLETFKRVSAAVALVGAVIVAVVLLAAGSSGVRRAQPTRQPPTRVSVWVNARDPGAPVPPRFLGLSFEVSSAKQLSYYADGGDLATLLRSLGPGVLRLGGASADTRVAWTDAHTPRPAWASSVLDPEDLHRLARLAAMTGWRVLLTIGLAHYEPRAAAREVAAAKAALGPWLMGIEVGNEPDSYALHSLRQAPWGSSNYNAQVSGYRSAIAAVTPNIAVAGPGVSGSGAFRMWAPAEALAQKPALLTGHHYPLGCRPAGEATIPRLLSQATRGLESESLRNYASISRASGIPFRIDETNTVSCGGKAGVSNTFAAALWAVNYIAQAMAVGATGINLEGNPATCAGYSPVCAPSPASLRSGALRPQPEWYALLLTRGLTGDRPLHTTIVWRKRANVAITTLLAPNGGLRFVIAEDDPPGSKDAALSLHVGGGYGAASVLALTAPSPHATAGVRLGGEAVAADGSWRGPRRLEQLSTRHGTISLTVPPSSAALVTVAPARVLKRLRPPAPPTHSCARKACANAPRARYAAARRRARRQA
jgi:hypothetical protein